MPERLAYDEAMQFSQIRLKIPVPELKQGKVEMVSIPTSKGVLERPWGIEGGFAVVYKFRRQNGTVCALRCFRVPMSPDTQFRYERIGPYFHTHALSITAGFHYYDAAIVVKEQGKPPDQRYPVIEMDWIEGVTLVDKVHELVKKSDRPALKALTEEWLSILRLMQQTHIAHGDLSGVNVMVHANNKLVLIDYDGVYIPEFAGLSQVVIGQEDFQHPQMAQRKFDEHMDAFSALVIYCALLALAIKPELWNTYAKISPDGKLQDVNMLFRQPDFLNPQQSPLFYALEHLGDPQLASMTQVLMRACLQPINQFQFPFALIDPDYQQRQALATLEQALKTDDDEQIAGAWLPILEQYQPAQPYLNRAHLAQQRVTALKAFRQAIASGDLQLILNSYNAQQLDTAPGITSQERTLLTLARSFLQAYQNNSDDILNIADRLQNTLPNIRVVFTTPQQQRLTQISQVKQAQEAMQHAFSSKNIEQIASIYPILHLLKTLTPGERQMIEQTAHFMRLFTATNNGADEPAFLLAYDALCQEPYTRFFTFTPQQEQRALSIRQRTAAQESFHLALTSRSPWRIVKAYDPILDAYLSPTNRELLALARSLTDALRTKNDTQLLAVEDVLQQSPHHSFFSLTGEEQQIFSQATQRQEALRLFRAAIASKKPRAIAAAYPTSLDVSSALTPAEQELLVHARMFVHAFSVDEDQTFLDTLHAFQQSGLDHVFLITPQDQQYFILAQQRVQAIQFFRNALNSTPTDAQSILNAYDSTLLDTSSVVTPQEREIVDAAREYLAMYVAIKAAIQANSDEAIRQSYNRELAQRFTGITLMEQTRIDQAMLFHQLDALLAQKQYEQSLILAQYIQRTTGELISDPFVTKLQLATMRFVRQQDLENFNVRVESVQMENQDDTNYAFVSWQWPRTELIQDVLFLWQFETPPPPLSKIVDGRQPFDGQYLQFYRKDNALNSQEIFPVGRGTHLYISGYAALFDAWGQERIWRYSRGITLDIFTEETTSRQIIQRNSIN